MSPSCKWEPVWGVLLSLLQELGLLLLASELPLLLPRVLALIGLVLLAPASSVLMLLALGSLVLRGLLALVGIVLLPLELLLLLRVLLVILGQPHGLLLRECVPLKRRPISSPLLGSVVSLSVR